MGNAMRLPRVWCVAAMMAGAGYLPAAWAQVGLPFVMNRDAVPVALTNTPGDATRGRAIVANRQVGLCLLCHTGPFPEERFQGNLAPDLSGAGARWSEGQLRLRIIDARLSNPQTIMPPYYQSDPQNDATNRVGAAWQGKPILAAQQIEDVVTFLRTLK